MIDREAALDLLREPGPESHLVQHALASEAVMRALARHFGENEELWGLTGLLHDWDYPLTADEPARHGLESAEKLKDSLPEEALQAIRAHNAECNGCTVNGRFDVALRCGFTSDSYFVQFFKKYTGVSPGKYRGQATEADTLTDG